MHPAARRPAVTAFLLFSLGCGREGADLAPSQQGSPSDRALLRLIVSTTGHTRDPSGYRVTLGDFDAVARSPGDTLVFDSLGPGVHRLRLTGVARNCASPWTVPGTITVPAGTSTRGIEVTCDSALSDVLVISGTLAGLEQPLVLVRPTDGSTLGSLTRGSGVMDRRAAVSPDGRFVAFARLAIDPVTYTVVSMQVMKLRVADGTVMPLSEPVPWVSRLSWQPDGQELLATADLPAGYGIYRIPAEGGPPVRLALAGSAWDVTACANGQLLTTGTEAIDRRDATGRLLGTWSWLSIDDPQSPACSRDATQVALEASPGGRDISPYASAIFLIRAASGTLEQLTPSGAQTQDPTFSPTGDRVAFTSLANGYWNTDVLYLEGQKKGLRYTVHGYGYEPDWAPDLDPDGTGQP